MVTIQLDDTVDFLVDLLNIHSPTGYYHEAIDFVEARLKAICAGESEFVMDAAGHEPAPRNEPQRLAKAVTHRNGD